MWLTFFCVSTAVIACASLLLAFFAVLYARRALESPPLRLRSVELKAQSCEQLVEEHTQAITDLTNRLKMMKVRSASSHAIKDDNGLPDPYRDPDGWRRAMNSRMALSKINGG
jgi:hypothetical protein